MPWQEAGRHWLFITYFHGLCVWSEFFLLENVILIFYIYSVHIIGACFFKHLLVSVASHVEITGLSVLRTSSIVIQQSHTIERYESYAYISFENVITDPYPGSMDVHSRSPCYCWSPLVWVGWSLFFPQCRQRKMCFQSSARVANKYKISSDHVAHHFFPSIPFCETFE